MQRWSWYAIEAVVFWSGFRTITFVLARNERWSRVPVVGVARLLPGRSGGVGSSNRVQALGVGSPGDGERGHLTRMEVGSS